MEAVKDSKGQIFEVAKANIDFLKDLFPLWHRNDIKDIYFGLDGNYSQIVDFIRTSSPYHSMLEKEEAQDSPVVFNDISNLSKALLSDILICPISHQIMTDPVVFTDGISYERTAIEKWLKISNRSPMTNEEMQTKALIPNYTLRAVINLLAPSNEKKTFEKVN